MSSSGRSVTGSGRGGPPAPGRVAASLAWLLVAVCAVLAAVATPGMRGRAGASPPSVPENGATGLLWLTSDPFPAEIPPLSPGDVFWWQVGAHLADEVLGALTVEFASSGDAVDLPNGLELEVRACPVPWLPASPPSCLVGTRSVLARTPIAAIAAGEAVAVGDVAPDAPQWLLLGVSLPADAGDELQGRTGRLAVGLTASGDVAETVPTDPPTMPPTVPPTVPPTGPSTPATGAPATAVPPQTGAGPTPAPATTSVTQPANPTSTQPGEPPISATDPPVSPGGTPPPATAGQPAIPVGLPITGSDALRSALWAAGAIAAGLGLAAVARRRAWRAR